MRRPIASKSERSGTGVDMANLSKVVCHGESDKSRFGNPPQESNFQRLGISSLLPPRRRRSPNYPPGASRQHGRREKYDPTADREHSLNTRYPSKSSLIVIPTAR